MAGKSSSQRRALEALKARILPVFETAGYELIAPDILQPADIFLDRSGEDLRTRTFVFSDPQGHELCLRPDLTIPTCRYHLDRHARAPETQAHYCYSGPIFRHQPGGQENATRPREYDQAGIEWFGAANKPEADAELIRLSVSAIKAAGLTEYRLQLGDIGLFHALLDTIEMPKRWRRRLKQQFWRPAAFHDLLTSLSQGLPASPYGPLDTDALAQHLDEAGIPHLGNRRLEEISTRLCEKAADATAEPLAAKEAMRISRYLQLRGSPAAVFDDLSRLGEELGGPFAAALQDYKARLDYLDDSGIDISSSHFSADFGRTIEYYTGFVFQIELPAGALAGGGRYDRLLADIGAPCAIPALGCAIHTERLLTALAGEDV